MYQAEEVKSMDINVGDLLILNDNMIVPADCVLIKAPSNAGGECQIQTGQLDGERSLKPKYALQRTQNTIDRMLVSANEEAAAGIQVHCSAPDQSLFYFEGAVQLAEGGKTSRITLDNFLPRGATMQGSGGTGILALVVYTGADTKLVLNQGLYKYKTSNTEINLNLIFMSQLAQIMFFSMLFTILQSNFKDDHESSTYLYEGIKSAPLWNLGIFFSFWFIMMRYIPFDVILQTETGKILYTRFMEWDTEMMHYDKEQNKLI